MASFEPIIFELLDQQNESHLAFADKLEAIRREEDYALRFGTPEEFLRRPKMLPINAEHMSKHIGGIIMRSGGEPVGYNGIIFEYSGGIAEMGGLYFNPKYRGHGLFKPLKGRLFDLIRSKPEYNTVVSFTNGNSLSKNLDLGFRIAKRNEIPDEGLSNCLECSEKNDALKAGKLCCDTVVILEVDKLPYIVDNYS